MSTRLSQITNIASKLRIFRTEASHGMSPMFAAYPSTVIRVRHFSRLNRTSPVAHIAKALSEDGCVVIESMFTPMQISRLNTELSVALMNVSPGKAANSNTPPLPGGADAAVFGQNTKRLGNLSNSSAAFREEFVDNDCLHGVCTEIFRETGDYWLSTAQMIEIGPGSEAQPLHADAAGWWPFWSMGDKWTPEFAVNFLIATTDTTKDNGATGVVRGSHNIKSSDIVGDPTLDCWKFPDDEVEQVEIKAGDCLLLGGRIVHRGERNRTRNEFRRLLSCTVVSAALTPEEAHPLSLPTDGVRTLSERAKKFLGFRELATTIGPDVWQNHCKGGLKGAIGF